jgi:hypothetical protein
MITKDRVRRSAQGRIATVRARVRTERNLGGWKRSQRISLPIGDRLPVIFCTWRRLERLEHTLKQLAAQDIPVQAVIWNNSPERSRIDAVVASAEVPVVVHHSTRNIGGFGRFYLAREVLRAGHRSVIFIDDDQDFGPTTTSELLHHHRPRSLSGWWAFRFTGRGYGDRARCAPGEPASYVGTGGMIIDTAVFGDSRLFRCPRRFWFVEDLWLCYIANRHCDYEMFRSPAQFEVTEDEHALYLSLSRTKWQFQRYLIRRGWAPIRRGNRRVVTPDPVTATTPKDTWAGRGGAGHRGRARSRARGRARSRARGRAR